MPPETLEEGLLRTTHLAIAASVVLAACAQTEPAPARWGSTAWCESRLAALDKGGRCREPAPSVLAQAPAGPAKPAPLASEPQAAAPGPDSTRNEAERLVLAQPSTHYAVQVFADPSSVRLVRFADIHNLSDRLHLRVEHQGRTWHVLLLDVYPDIARARQGLRQVSERLPNGPWIRPVGELHAIIR